MDKYWTRLVIVGFVLILVVISWDFILTLTGYKSDFKTVVLPIAPTLFGKTEDLFRNDAKFSQYQELAAAQDQQ